MNTKNNTNNEEQYPPFCIRCEHYKPHKPMKTHFVYGLFVGDGRCTIGRRLTPPDYVTVETDSCEHWEAK